MLPRTFDFQAYFLRTNEPQFCVSEDLRIKNRGSFLEFFLRTSGPLTTNSVCYKQI